MSKDLTLDSWKQWLWPVILLIGGGLLAAFLIPREIAAVNFHLIGYPDASASGHKLRPWLIGVGCALPFIGSLVYKTGNILDRYLTRELILSFSICSCALLTLLLIISLQDKASDLIQAADTGTAIVKFYLIQLPAFMMIVLPYSLMLALLWSLGKLSKSCEIVAMMQTGRSVVRMLRPLIVSGIFLTVLMFIFNYHWAPYAEGYEKQILKSMKGEKTYAAKDVGHFAVKGKRFWSVGMFPNNFSQGGNLEKITIVQRGTVRPIDLLYKAQTATWNEQSGSWHLQDVIIWDYTKDPNTAKGRKVDSLHISDWEETPWQIIRPGLKAELLGLPELNSWIKNHPDHPLSDRRTYETMRQFRWAQPVNCLIIVLLATPLGIVFTRRGAGSGIAVAIFLCIGMFFCNSVFPTLGESGNLTPFFAAWGTNILFFCVAAYLFYRRSSGKNIYQSLKTLLPN